MSDSGHQQHANTMGAGVLNAYAKLILRRPLAVLISLLALASAAGYAASKLTINSNQLELISQDLQEVKDVKRLIDMVGGSGFLMLAVRSGEGPVLRQTADDLAEMISADKADVRSVTYKVPVEFIQKNMVLFIKTEDLAEGKRRLNEFIRAQANCANPFSIDLDGHCEKLKHAKPNLDDLIDKYSHVGKKSIREDYYVSDDGQMIILLIKPMWDTNELEKTKVYLDKLYKQIADYSARKPHGATMVQSYDRETPAKGVITFGFTGNYKVAVDDSYAIAGSLGPVTIYALIGIILITFIFFRKVVPSIIVLSGMIIGTIMAMGFTWVVFKQLNMITSILGGILMGFGVDYGIQFIYRTRIELGSGKRYDVAIHDALVNAGRPASVAAIVTSGSFFMLLTSQFRGFSQFGLLAGFGTMLIGFTLFCWSPALLSLIGRMNPEWPAKLIGSTPPPRSMNEGGEIRIPHPRLLLGIAGVVTAILCACAIPWVPFHAVDDKNPTLWERVRSGIRFNYNTRALLPEGQSSVNLTDEINDRFQISSDNVAVFSQTLAETKDVYEEIDSNVKYNQGIEDVEQGAWNKGESAFADVLELYPQSGVAPEAAYRHAVALNRLKRFSEARQALEEFSKKYGSSPLATFAAQELAYATASGAGPTPAVAPAPPMKYSTVDQVVSLYSFVPPPARAAANTKVLEEWQKELSDIDINALPPDVQKQAEFFKSVLADRPFGVEQVPQVYATQFTNLPETKPENRGYLTWIYPRIDLRDGKAMVKFAEEVAMIHTPSGASYHSAGQPLLFAQLAKMVLHDGIVTVFLTAIWILFMHFLDFRSVPLALASVIPLGVGLVMMLGIMSVTDHQLNFMNIIILPILLGFGVSHGLYLLHRFLEGTSPVVALRSVGAAVASSTLTAIAGFGALFAAAHHGLKSMGYVACTGLTTTLLVSFTVLAAVLQLLHDRRTANRVEAGGRADAA